MTDSSHDRSDRTATGTALIPTPEANTALDVHGFDPADYDWIPVKRKRREDGWTPERQRQFIEELADTGSVTQAALATGMSVSSAYRLRRMPEGAGFATAWDIAIQNASRRLIDIAFDRAVHGSEEPVFDRDGRRVGRRVKYNDRLLMFLLRAHQPERFRLAHRADRDPREALPAALPLVADALAALAPVTPVEPHRLMSPEALEDAIEVADLLDGELPRWHRTPSEVEEVETNISLGAAFEEALAAAKREAGGDLREEDDDERWDDDEDWEVDSDEDGDPLE